FEIPRYRLCSRLQGRPTREGNKSLNSKLLEPEEKALYRFINRLNDTNLMVRPLFIT
ncbi:hypothetical protein SODALDRAFT_246565, partial [Sodiomyces alkalinus F11]